MLLKEWVFLLFEQVEIFLKLIKLYMPPHLNDLIFGLLIFLNVINIIVNVFTS